MNGRLYWMLALSTGLAIGCGPGDKVPSGTDTDAASTDVATDTGAAGGSAITGRIVDPDGAPVSDVALKYCRGLACATTRTDAAGDYAFTGMAGGPGSFAAVPPEGRPWVHAFAPFDVPEDESSAINVTFVERGAGAVLGDAAAPLTVGALEITVSKSEIETPVLLEDATHLYAPEVWGTPGAVPVQLEGAVLAQWLLEPHDYPIPAGAPIRVANSFGLAAGSAVTLYVGRYSESDWVPVGNATVAKDWITFDAELELVSTLVLVQAR